MVAIRTLGILLGGQYGHAKNPRCAHHLGCRVYNVVIVRNHAAGAVSRARYAKVPSTYRNWPGQRIAVRRTRAHPLLNITVTSA